MYFTLNNQKQKIKIFIIVSDFRIILCLSVSPFSLQLFLWLYEYSNGL